MPRPGKARGGHLPGWLLLALLCFGPAAPDAIAGPFRRPAGEEKPAAAPALRPDSLRAKPRQEAAALPDETARRGVSPAGAFLRSAVVPGWGQAALARSRPELQGRGRTGFWLDLGLVAGAWGLARLSEIKESEYQGYARRAAGAAGHGEGSDYWVDVSNYRSRADFNQAMLESGLPQRRYLDPADDWSWPSQSSLIRYRDLRAVSERASAQALAACGAVFINHLFSGVQALRLARQEWELSAVPVDGRLGLALSLDLTTPRP